VQKQRDVEMTKGGKAAAKLSAQAEIKAASIRDEEKRVGESETKLKEVCSCCYIIFNH